MYLSPRTFTQNFPGHKSGTLAHCQLFEIQSRGSHMTPPILCVLFVSVVTFIYNFRPYSSVLDDQICLNAMQREISRCASDVKVTLQPVTSIQNNKYARRMVLAVQQRKITEVLDTNDVELEDSVRHTLCGHSLRVGQKIPFRFKNFTLVIQVQIIHCIRKGDDFTDSSDQTDIDQSQSLDGLIVPQTEFFFLSGDVNQTGVQIRKKKMVQKDIFQISSNLEELGIGGLSKEFADINRRAFTSRANPGIAEQFGNQHVKGILLYGPPGTGKTLIARQIGKLLKAREPKIVNGPEILNKFVGQSEENIRALFADAEKEQKERGDASGLHIIIFDELDAICKQRGMTASSSSGVGDTVVNQLLSKIDGVNSLNNILLIGMTNRKDLIDEALLRPGRLEIHIEVSLPDEKGRLEILRIKTAKMRESKRLDPSVDLAELAARTKNFSGAEIEGLIRSASSWAMDRISKNTNSDDVRANSDDFNKAFEEVKPAFGVQEEQLKHKIQYGICQYNADFSKMLKELLFTVRNDSSYDEGSVVIPLLVHGLNGCGKSALAAHVAKESDFGFVKFVSAKQMAREGEAGRCARLVKIFDDAEKSTNSLIILDDLEKLLDYTPVGPRFHNSVLQLIKSSISDASENAKGRLVVIATTSHLDFINYSGLGEAFLSTFEIPSVHQSDLPTVIRHWQGLKNNIDNPEGVAQEFLSCSSRIPIKKAFEVLKLAERFDEDGVIRENNVQRSIIRCRLAKKDD